MPSEDGDTHGDRMPFGTDPTMSLLASVHRFANFGTCCGGGSDMMAQVRDVCCGARMMLCGVSP